MKITFLMCLLVLSMGCVVREIPSSADLNNHSLEDYYGEFLIPSEFKGIPRNQSDLWTVLTNQEEISLAEIYLATHLKLSPGGNGCIKFSLTNGEKTLISDDFKVFIKDNRIDLRDQFVGHLQMFIFLYGLGKKKTTLWLNSEDDLIISFDVGGGQFTIILPVFYNSDHKKFTFRRDPQQHL